jgi:hypothetical protein
MTGASSMTNFPLTLKVGSGQPGFFELRPTEIDDYN